MAQQSKISSNNTRVFYNKEYDRCEVFLHATRILSIDDGVVTLNSGGWQSVTTKTRMNQCAKEWELGFGVFQTKGKWYVKKPGFEYDEAVPFSDGMQFHI